MGPKSFFGFTDSFHFVKFLFSDFFAVGAILSLLGPIRPFFGVGVGSKNFLVGFHI